MKFWQLFLISMLAMAAMVRAQEEAPQDAAEAEANGEEAHEEPAAEAEPEAHDDDGAEQEPAPEPEGTDEPQEVDAGDEVEEQEEVVEEEVHHDHVNEVESEPVETEDIETSKTAGLESDNGDDNGATSVCLSFSTVILSSLVALKFAH